MSTRLITRLLRSNAPFLLGTLRHKVLTKLICLCVVFDPSLRPEKGGAGSSNLQPPAPASKSSHAGSRLCDRVPAELLAVPGLWVLSPKPAGPKQTGLSPRHECRVLSHYGLQPRLGTGALLDAPRTGPLTTSQKPKVTATLEEMRAVKEDKLRHHESPAAPRSETRPKGLAAQRNAASAARERASGRVSRVPGVPAALHRTEMQLPQLPL